MFFLKRRAVSPTTTRAYTKKPPTVVSEKERISGFGQHFPIIQRPRCGGGRNQAQGKAAPEWGLAGRALKPLVNMSLLWEAMTI